MNPVDMMLDHAFNSGIKAGTVTTLMLLRHMVAVKGAENTMADIMALNPCETLKGKLKERWEDHGGIDGDYKLMLDFAKKVME